MPYLIRLLEALLRLLLRRKKDLGLLPRSSV